MTAKAMGVTLVAVLVLVAVAATAGTLLTAAPTAAQPAPTNTPIPSNTPIPATTPIPSTTPTPANPPERTGADDAETLEQLKTYCRDAQPQEVVAIVFDAGDGPGKTVSLEWWANADYWRLPDGMLAHYRIQRRADDGDEWQTLETVTNTDVWKGPAEIGHWIYRVGLVELVSGEATRECQPQWPEASVDVLTPQEELQQYCDSLYVYNIEATGEPATDGHGGTLTLRWQSGHDLPYPFHSYFGFPALPEGTVITYRIERMRDARDGSEGSWETVAEVRDTKTWTGIVEPGRWIFRVALVRLQTDDLVQQCQKPQWGEVEVLVLTAEERAKAESDQRILVEQATSCALDVLSDNLTPEASAVIGEYIRSSISDIAMYSDFGELATITVLFCTDREAGGDRYDYPPSRQEFILLVLFDGSHYW